MLNCTESEIQKTPLPKGIAGTENRNHFEPFHPQTVTEVVQIDITFHVQFSASIDFQRSHVDLHLNI